MTPEDVDRVVRVARRVHDDTMLSTEFYRLLFARRPDLRLLFPPDMQHQLARFVTELEGLALCLPELSAFEQRAHGLGERHHHYGVRAEHYPVVREALLDALSVHLAPGFDSDDRVAWARAFNLLAEMMLEGAEQLAVPPE
jgi:hemoglobin-like flavoprotein